MSEDERDEDEELEEVEFLESQASVEDEDSEEHSEEASEEPPEPMSPCGQDVVTMQQSQATCDGRLSVPYIMLSALGVAPAQGQQEMPIFGRDRERTYVREYLEACRHTESPGCFYVSGPPGTGKTSAVLEVVREFCQGTPEGTKEYTYVRINCVTEMLTRRDLCPSDMLLSIMRELGIRTGLERMKRENRHKRMMVRQRVEEFERTLEDRFASETEPRVIVVLDEADSLYSDPVRLRCLFTVFDWPLRNPRCKCVIIAIANAASPPQGLWQKLKSRIGLWRVHFSPYTAGELESIVVGRVSAVLRACLGLDDSHCALEREKTFPSILMRKLASRLSLSCGDARRMMALCRSSLESAIEDFNSFHGTNDSSFVCERHVAAALEELAMASPLSTGISTLEPNVASLLYSVMQLSTVSPQGFALLGQAISLSVSRCKSCKDPVGTWREELELSVPVLEDSGLIVVDRNHCPSPLLWRARLSVEQEIVLSSIRLRSVTP